MNTPVIGRPCHMCGEPSGEFGLQPDMKYRCVACKIKLLGHEPRELTEEEMRKRFLNQVQGIVDFWLRDSRQETVREKLEGVAFSILTILDGESGDLPGFHVTPSTTKEDQEFWKSIGEDWWASTPKEILNNLKVDLAGSLHDEYCKLNGGS